jgi:hypothetical protein
MMEMMEEFVATTWIHFIALYSEFEDKVYLVLGTDQMLKFIQKTVYYITRVIVTLLIGQIFGFQNACIPFPSSILGFRNWAKEFGIDLSQKI